MDTTLRQRKFESTSTRKDAVQDDDAKHNTAASHGWGIFVIALVLASVLCCLLVVALLPAPIDPVSFSLPPPPEFKGPLARNEKLSQAEHLFENEIEGPESVVADGDHLYTGTMDGKILDLYKGEQRVLARLGKPPCGGLENEHTCGRPLGMRMDKEGYLIVADAYLGLFKVNVATGDVHELYSSKVPVAGKMPKFLNDLDIASDGTIYITDSSTKWERRNNRYCVYESETSGRLLAFNPSTKEMSQLFDGLAFPNGVQLSIDEDFILICETSRARIWRYWLKGSKEGQLEVFMDNVPGLPDNIRRNRRGTFWVGLATARRAGTFSFLDFAADKPWLRSIGTKLLSQETILSMIPKYGMVIEVDKQGNIVRSLQDPSGKVVPSTSEVEEKDGVLYFGSYNLPYLSRLRIK